MKDIAIDTSEYAVKHIVKYLLFNNPEQAENLKRPRPVTLRNKGGRTMRPGLKIIAIHERSKRLWVVRLSDQAYTVDALAVRGDEGRANLRKAPAR